MKKSLLITTAFVAVVTVSLAFTRNDPGYKNLKILPKNITQHQMDSVMDHFSRALNVGCDFCHVENKGKNEMDFASDENKHKLIARDMMTMTNTINDTYFNYTGAQRDINTQLMVTCITCHNGSKMPETQKVAGKKD